MNILFVAGIILLICAVASKVMYRYGIPTLIIFLTMGMVMGSDGLGGIYFNDPVIAENLCNIGLIFIMFSGGFGTNWKTAKPVAVTSAVLATAGVILTALLIGIFTHLVFGFTFLEGMLLGSIVSSTDAASVFSILRSKNLNLKNGLAPMLEMESGSNDPIAYMLTTVFLGLIIGSKQNIFIILTTQIFIGVLVGIIIGKIAVWFINNINLDIDGLYSIIVIGIALLTYSGASMLSGNGFLAVYIVGLIMGNNRLVHKVSLVRYFDGLSWLMQILLFFTLGLLVFPSQLLSVSIVGMSISLFIIFIARPVAIFTVLTLFKRPIKDQLLVSWVGFRGAASIVFATYPLVAGIGVANQIFNTVFFISLTSVLIQGTLFIPIAKKLDLIAQEETVLKTFTDFSGEIYTELLEISVKQGSIIAEKEIKDIDFPMDILVVMIKRGDKIITPKGTTIIKVGDIIMLAGDNKQNLIEMETIANN